MPISAKEFYYLFLATNIYKIRAFAINSKCPITYKLILIRKELSSIFSNNFSALFCLVFTRDLACFILYSNLCHSRFTLSLSFFLASLIWCLPNIPFGLFSPRLAHLLQQYFLVPVTLTSNVLVHSLFKHILISLKTLNLPFLLEGLPLVL